jgi:ferredoxin
MFENVKRPVRRSISNQGIGDTGGPEFLVQAELEALLDDERTTGPDWNARTKGKFKGNVFAGLSLREKLSLVPLILRNFWEMKRSYRGLDHTPERDSIDDDELEALEEKAEQLGVESIGYTIVEREDILKDDVTDRSVLYQSAIVFSCPMDQEAVGEAPGYSTLKTVNETYLDTGVVANELAEFLKERGFGAQADPGLGGKTNFPTLADRAGIGEFGRHGMIMTPENGITQRLGAVYTNIENLPTESAERDDWVWEFCQQCGKCVRDCPPDAIRIEPEGTEGENLSFYDEDACSEYFGENNGCAVCMTACPFNRVEYEDLEMNVSSRVADASQPVSENADERTGDASLQQVADLSADLDTTTDREEIASILEELGRRPGNWEEFGIAYVASNEWVYSEVHIARGDDPEPHAPVVTLTR